MTRAATGVMAHSGSVIGVGRPILTPSISADWILGEWEEARCHLPHFINRPIHLRLPSSTTSQVRGEGHYRRKLTIT